VLIRPYPRRSVFYSGFRDEARLHGLTSRPRRLPEQALRF